LLWWCQLHWLLRV